MKFGTKIVGLLTLLAVVPILTSIVLVEEAIRAGETVAKEHEQDLSAAIGRAAEAYRELFEARKEQFRAAAIAIATTWNGHIDDPVARYIRRWRVEPDGPSGAAEQAFPDALWRSFMVRQALSGGRTLEIEFVARRERFAEYEAIGTLTQKVQITHFDEAKHRAYHWIFVGMFTALLLPLVGVGVVIARRTTRRVSALASAARAVGAGDLGIRVDGTGADEIAELGRAFNDMVGELADNRARITYLEKIGAWQEVARRLAHEIKNPLTPIQLSVQQLESTYAGDDPRFRKLLGEVGEIVREEIGTLRRLVEEFSAFAKLPQVVQAPLDLAEIVADVVRAHPDWEGRVRPEALTEPLTITADKQLLRRVIVNLVENALAAGAKIVTIRVGRVEGQRAHLIIDDDGPGVPPDLRERVFEPYYTTKEHGTGLGLAIVRKIALEHGGDVSLEESPSGGARFLVDFPAPRSVAVVSPAS